MANKRMFSQDIICSEEFTSMPLSSQALYLQLGIRADDDGFVQPKQVMRTVNASEDDLKILLAKRFLISFENGVVVIKHWLIHNLIRGDRYKATRFLEQKNLLKIKENKAYTEIDGVGRQIGNQLATQSRVEEVSIDKDSISEETSQDKSIKENKNKEITEIIELFGIFNQNNYSWFKNKTQREDIKWLIEKYTLEKVKKAIYLTAFAFNDSFYPSISTPHELREKLAKMKKYWQGKEIKDKRFIQDFDKYIVDEEKKLNSKKEQKIIEKTIMGRKVIYKINN
jgi:hypothetical protein